MGSRTLPIRVPPVPGEALDSWLGALAQRLGTSWGDLLAAILPPTNRASVTYANLTAYLHPTESSAIAAVTGVWPPTIEGLTLARYDGHLVSIDRSTRRLQSLPWPPVRSRFCPQCLLGAGGRWQLVWRLPWVFVCQEHGHTLADTCPACGKFQRMGPRWPPINRVPELVRCTARVDSDGQRRVCGGNLLQAETIALTPDHPLALSQARLSDSLSTASTSFGIYKAMPTSSLQVLRDLRVLAARIFSLANAETIGDLLGANATRSMNAQFPDLVSSVRRFAAPKPFATTAPAPTTGLGITLALSILGCSTIEEAAARLRPIIGGAKASGRTVTPYSLEWRGSSAALAAAQLKAYADWSGPLDPLRYRTGTKLPRYPDELSPTAVRGIPTCLWREWSFRFVVGAFHVEVMRPVLSLMLLRAGSRISELSAARLLGWPTNWQKIGYVLKGLYGHPLWPNMCSATIRLVDYLAEHPSPIDYQRRRQLDYRDLLSGEQWNDIYDQGYFGSRERHRVGAMVRTWLFERISMQPAHLSPFAEIYRCEGWQRAEVVALFTPKVARDLDGVAARFLERHNVTGEPVTWSPPLSIVSDLELPGPDPGAISISDLHKAVADSAVPLSTVAREFGVPTEVVCYLLECSPLDRQVNQTQLDYAATQLSKAEFLRLYQHDQLSVTAMAARIGVGHDVMFDLARKYEIEVRSRRTVRRAIDPDWLYQEYVVKQRTLTDMADEIGVGVNTLVRRAKRQGILVWRDPRARSTSAMF